MTLRTFVWHKVMRPYHSSYYSSIKKTWIHVCFDTMEVFYTSHGGLSMVKCAAIRDPVTGHFIMRDFLSEITMNPVNKDYELWLANQILT